jgi:hypothetical protein
VVAELGVVTPLEPVVSRNAPNIQALARHFARLTITDLAFRQCKALAEHMIDEHLDVLSPLFTPQMAGVVVTYAKNFVSAESFGSLKEPFIRFTDDAMQETHDKLIDARNKLYAHRDAAAARSFIYDNASPRVPYQVRVELRKGETSFTAFRGVPELNPTILPFIIRLCDLQIERVRVEVSRIIPIMTADKTYKAGIYTVGIDFP